MWVVARSKRETLLDFWSEAGASAPTVEMELPETQLGLAYDGEESHRGISNIGE